MISKDIKEIKEKLDSLSTTIIDKAQKYDEIQEMLKSLKFRVAKTYATWDDKRMQFVVKVEYQIPSVTLIVDEDGSAMLNDRFKAINTLNLIPFEDMEKVAVAIGKAHSQNKEN